MSVGKITIATVLLVATFAGCEWYGTLLPPTHWAFAIFVNFIFLAVATALMTALELPLFPPSYFDSRRFEKNGRIYRWVGIHAFVAILRCTGWEKIWRKQIPVHRDLHALSKYADSTRGSEAVHVVTGICTMGLTLSIALRYSLVATKWLWIANALVNLFPVLLQRYNRPRVERLVLRLAQRTNTNSTEQCGEREPPMTRVLKS